MRDTMLIALEAAWELDPVRLDKKLWDMIDKTVPSKENVEQKSNHNRRSVDLSGVERIGI